MKLKQLFNPYIVGSIFYFLTVYNSFSQSNWMKHQNNPILENFSTWTNDLMDPVVLHHDGIFKMWFGAMTSGTVQIGYAESVDGINWIPLPNPVILSGNTGNWDQDKSPGSVLIVNDTIKMWFSASTTAFEYDGTIGYAWSVDSNIWNVLPNPVLEPGSPGNWEETGVLIPALYFDGNNYHMWYNGWEGLTLTDPGRVGYATSTNGIDWVKYSNNPVIDVGPNGTFYDTWILPSSIMFINNEFQLWFTGYDGFHATPIFYFKIGYATSPDGISWTIQNNDLPVLDVQSGSWENLWVREPSVIIHNKRYHMWYAGMGSNLKIGYAIGDTTIVCITEHSLGESLNCQLYPNPLKDFLFVQFDQIISDISIEVLNIIGQIVSVQKFTSVDKIKLDLSSHRKGIYIVKIRMKDAFGSYKIIHN
jgi:predicted GH43/DUF377 family glycosyl hydrolase